MSSSETACHYISNNHNMKLTKKTHLDYGYVCVNHSAKICSQNNPPCKLKYLGKGGGQITPLISQAWKSRTYNKIFYKRFQHYLTMIRIFLFESQAIMNFDYCFNIQTKSYILFVKFLSYITYIHIRNDNLQIILWGLECHR